jgi:mevalonate kinase
MASQDEQVVPAPDGQDDSSLPDNETAVSGEPVNIQRAFSKLNSAIAEMCDSLGVRRSATCPHQEGQSMADHIQDVGQVLSTIGGVTANLLIATHTKHSSTGGETVAYSANKLRETIIPKDAAEVKAAINACRSFVSKVASLVGGPPEVKTAQSQIKMVGKNGSEQEFVETQ